MIPVAKWDDKLTLTSGNRITRWDEWFEGTADTESIKTWSAAKRAFTELEELEWWATIIELNRLDRLEKKNPSESD